MEALLSDFTLTQATLVLLNRNYRGIPLWKSLETRREDVTDGPKVRSLHICWQNGLSINVQEYLRLILHTSRATAGEWRHRRRLPLQVHGGGRCGQALSQCSRRRRPGSSEGAGAPVRAPASEYHRNLWLVPDEARGRKGAKARDHHGAVLSGRAS